MSTGALSSEATKVDTFVHLRGKFGYAIRKRLSQAMDWDEAGAEGDFILWRLITDYDPTKNDNIEAYVATNWHFYVNKSLERAFDYVNATTPLEEGYGLPSCVSAEDEVIRSIDKRDAVALVDGFDLDPLDREAVLAFYETENGWREGSGDRKARSRGAMAADVYAAHGVNITPIQASRKVRCLVDNLRKEVAA